MSRCRLCWVVALILLSLGLPHSAVLASASGQVMITEFMASNDTTLADKDGDYPDWIEIHNGGATDVYLGDWYLTDDETDLTRWQLPSITLTAGSYLVVFASDKDRAVAGSELHTNFKLKSGGEYLALVEPDGVTIAWEYGPEYPPQFEDVSYGLAVAPGHYVVYLPLVLHRASEFDFRAVSSSQLASDCAVNGYAGKARYFTVPTPGSVNGACSADLGPIISGAGHTPFLPAAGETITVTVAVEESYAPVAAVVLNYRVMYGATAAVTMYDDGVHGDGAAGDTVYGATIPGSAHQPGEMARYYVTATDAGGRTSRWPLFHNPTGSPEYLGTLIADPGAINELPVLYWFVRNPSAAMTDSGTRASLFYNGIFYDNVFVRLRGHSAKYWPKKSFRFEFNQGYYFQFSPDEEPVEEPVKEFNLNTTYSDKAYIRQPLAWETYRDAHVPYCISFPMRVQQNGAFHSVAVFVEQPNEQYLERQGLDPDGALYKMYNRLDSATSGVEKKTRLDEDHSDLQALIDGVNLSGAARTNYLFDNVDLPAVINYLTANVIMHDIDCSFKNYYLYRDTEGTGEWTFLPWDKDLTFGRNWANNTVLNDVIYADHDPHSHPIILRYNHLVNALHATPTFQEMYLRRLRTLMDDLLQPPAGTLVPPLYYEPRVDELFAQMRPDVVLDAAKWPLTWGLPQTFTEAVNILKADYLAVRRVHLYDTHGPGNGGIIPDAQPVTTSVDFGTVEFNPTSGDQDEEYFTLVNPNNYAVDISGWTIANDVEYTFQPGVVVPASGTLYVSPDVVAFRTRAISPTGGEGRFVQGDYDGHLSNVKGILELYNAGGTLIVSTTFESAPSPFTGQLIVTELNYHPPDGDEGVIDGDEFEFIELKNVSTATLSLGGFQFTDGISYTFPATATLGPGQILVLIRDETAFASRYPGVAYVGIYDKKLSNSGETITLIDADRFVVTSFEYDDEFPWPETPDGDGYTLVRRDPDSPSPGDPNDPDCWRASTDLYGSPGVDDPSGSTVVWGATVEIEPGLMNMWQFADIQ